MTVCVLSSSGDTKFQLEAICNRRNWKIVFPNKDCDLDFIFCKMSNFDVIVIDFNSVEPIHYYMLGANVSKSPALLGYGDEKKLPELFYEATYTLDNMKSIEHAIETISLSGRCTSEEAMSSWAAGNH
jgi:hypothetical protein